MQQHQCRYFAAKAGGGGVAKIRALVYGEYAGRVMSPTLRTLNTLREPLEAIGGALHSFLNSDGPFRKNFTPSHHLWLGV